MSENNNVNGDEIPELVNEKRSEPIPVLDSEPTFFEFFMGERPNGWQLIAGYLTVVAADVCLFQNYGGSGAAVMMLVMAIALISARRSYAVGGSIAAGLVILSANGIWNTSELTVFLSWLLLIFLAIKLARPTLSITELFFSATWVALFAPFRGVHFITATISPAADKPKKQMNMKIIFLPVILVAIFGGIFYAASPAFEKLIDRGVEKIEDFLANINYLRLFFWACWVCVFAALLSPAIKFSLNKWLELRRETLEPEEYKEAVDASPAYVSLICVNVLFALFILFDNYHFISGREIPNDISYSSYAKRGCFWLTVALFASTVTIGWFFSGALNFHSKAKALHKLVIIWAAQNMVLAICALWRLGYYIEYNGLTRARIKGFYGIILVAVGLVFVVMKMSRRKNLLWLIRRDLAALLVALIVLAVTPRDYICWTYNVREAMNGNLRPLSNFHIQTLSSEALPPLIPLLGHRNEDVRRGVAGLLGTRLEALADSSEKPWQKWQGADDYALRKLAKHAIEIDKLAPPAKRDEYFQKLLEKTRPWFDSGNWDYEME